MKKMLFAMAVLAIAGASHWASAATDAVDPPSQTVSTAGVDFHDRAAVESVYVKMTRAAEAVCNSYAANSRVTASDRACASEALAKAVHAVNQPILTALYEGDRRPTRLAARTTP